jgi:hypothetical protein
MAIALIASADHSCRAQTQRKPKCELESQWLSRASGYVDVLHGKDRVEATAFLSAAYARSGDWRRARELVGRIEDRSARQSQVIALAASIARDLGAPSALAYAETLDRQQAASSDEADKLWSERDGALLVIAKVQCDVHDFPGAAATVGRVADPRAASSGWQNIARWQGEAGLYDDADRSLLHVTIYSEPDRGAENELRIFIARCRSTGRKEAAKKNQNGLLNGLRRTAGLFDGSTAGDRSGAVAERKAAQLSGGWEKADAWRQAAWAYYREADVPKARRAIAQSLASAETIPLSHQRALNYVLLADLCAELGDVVQSKQLALKSAALYEPRAPLGGLCGITTMPLVVSVLVRVGMPEDAAAVLDGMRDGDSGPAWATFAATCALMGRLDFVQNRLSAVRSDRLGAILCAGVVLGLVEKRQTGPLDGQRGR